jgi:hypothetical protein
MVAIVLLTLRYFYSRSVRSEALERAQSDGIENAAQLLGFEGTTAR